MAVPPAASPKLPPFGPADVRLHASCVALDGRGVLILGRSGSGKSGLALQLMALGATLISDDQTLVHASDGDPVASAPESTRGLIEARGVGLLAADTAQCAPIALAIDLDHVETRRLPETRTFPLPGRDVPLLYRVENPYFVAAIVQYLKAGKADS